MDSSLIVELVFCLEESRVYLIYHPWNEAKYPGVLPGVRYLEKIKWISYSNIISGVVKCYVANQIYEKIHNFIRGNKITFDKCQGNSYSIFVLMGSLVCFSKFTKKTFLLGLSKKEKMFV
jgi:hypothetical protein